MSLKVRFYYVVGAARKNELKILLNDQEISDFRFDFVSKRIKHCLIE